MQHSILSRFEGALLGAVLGETLGYHALKMVGQSRGVKHWYPGLSLASVVPPGAIAPTLLNRGNQLIAAGGWQPTQVEPPTQPDNAAMLTLTHLPVILLHHASDWQLEQQLGQMLETWDIPPLTGKAWLGMSQAIAHILKEAPLTSAWLLNFASALGVPVLERGSTVAQQMDPTVAVQARSRLPAGWLHDLPRRVSPFLPDSQAEGTIAVLLALSYFLRTPTDLPTSLLAAAHSPYAPQLVCPLVGALAGAWGGCASIPLTWSIHLEKTPLLGLFRADIHTLAQALFRRWAGVLPGHVQLEVAIAAPNIIRPRI